MRALVVSIWVFINLVFFGMCGYMYLLWSQYWMYLEHQTESTPSKYDRQIYFYNRGMPLPNLNESEEKPAGIKTRSKHSAKDNLVLKNSKPRFPNLDRSGFETDTDKYQCRSNDSSNECDKKVLNYKEALLRELNRVFTSESDIFKTGVKNQNRYNVKFAGHRSSNQSPTRLLCDLKRIKIKTLKKRDKALGLTPLNRYLPRKELFENKQFRSCAIVASAGSLQNSNLGKTIDSHEVVMRFNHAPTKDFETDVGKRTTMRIVNSQVVSKPDFSFLQSNLYRNVTLLAWDPSNYTAKLEDWYRRPEFDLFSNYIQYKKFLPRSKFFLVNPISLWELWDFLQRNSPNRLRRNPPSSGFLGLAVLLPVCDYVDMFEYVPSARVTKRCHYYDPEDNPACTFGVWHPLAAEKLLTYAINAANDSTVFRTGFVRIPGFKKIRC